MKLDSVFFNLQQQQSLDRLNEHQNSAQICNYDHKVSIKYSLLNNKHLPN